MSKKTLKPTILIVEDEEAISSMIKYNVDKEGFQSLVANDGEEGLFEAKERKPDLILLDWMLPSMSGVDVCKNLRKDSNTRNIPIIMITAKGEDSDIAMGLDSGADDYIVKPFSPKELIARIKAVFRRIRPALSAEKIEFQGVTLDQGSQRVSFDGKEIFLGPTEFRILRHFMEHPEHVFSREQLLDSVWGHDIYVEIRTVDVHIRRLRKALDDTKAGLGEIIRTVRSSGYSLQKLA